MTRNYSDSIALAAARIVAASGVDITQPVPILPLAKRLMQETGCGIDAAKRHIARAVRLARGESINPPTWGGHRTPAGGRPTMTNYRITFIAKDGETKTVTVQARNTFEATQIAGAFNCTILALEDLDA